MSRSLKRQVPVALMLCLLIPISSGCQESEEVALKRQLEARAAAQPPQATAAMGYTHQRAPGSGDDGPLRARGAGGEVIEVTDFYLITSAIELHVCEPDRDTRQGRNNLWDLLIAPAYAHVPSSALRLGVPYVEDLLQTAGTARMVGGIAPPLGDYCRMYAILSPADDDVLNLTMAELDDLEGKTMWIKGRWRAEDATEDAADSWKNFTIVSQARIPVEMTMVNPQTGATPLELQRAGDHAMVLVSKTISPGLFDDLDVDELSHGDAGDQILERLVKTFHMYEFGPRE